MSNINKSQTITVTSLGNVTQQPFRPKHPDYMAYEDRLHTFKLWPKESSHSPEALAEMGFCYNYQGDQIYCFCCNCEMSQLKPGEDLWVRHAIIASECIFLRNRKGEKFIQEAENKVFFNEKSSTINNSHEQQPKIKIIFATPLDCKICFSRQIKILFLPCSHLAICAHCSISLDKCCICKETIEFMVRVSLPKEVDNESEKKLSVYDNLL